MSSDVNQYFSCSSDSFVCFNGDSDDKILLDKSMIYGKDLE